jgi:hypothetical protein
MATQPAQIRANGGGSTFSDWSNGVQHMSM